MFSAACLVLLLVVTAWAIGAWGGSGICFRGSVGAGAAGVSRIDGEGDDDAAALEFDTEKEKWTEAVRNYSQSKENYEVVLLS